MSAFEAIFLDLDGCLVDSTRAITSSFDHALQSVGIAPRSAEITRTFIGPPLRETFDRIVEAEGRNHETASLLVTRYREHYRANSATETTVIPGILDVLLELQTIAPIAIVTSKLGAVAESLVDDIGLRSHVQVVHAPRDEHVIESKVTTLERALFLSGARAHASVMIGDREHDVLAGHACGTATIGVLWGAGDRAELEAARAHAIVEHVGDLTQVVRALAASPLRSR